MNTEMKVFENPDFGQVRTVTKDGEPWFVAADVCKALEINNSRDAVARLDDDEKAAVGLTDTSSNGVTQKREIRRGVKWRSQRDESEERTWLKS